jgi:Leucine-rich repeat (LRR) protein
MVGAKGLQVISSVDPELAMKDEDLEKLMMIAPHIISLDLTDSKVTNAGFDFIAKMPNLKKLFLEGVQEIDVSGITKLKNLQNLEYLNLIRVKLEASAVDFLISLESLREVYLFETGLDETAIGKLKTAKPQVFVNSG